MEIDKPGAVSHVSTFGPGYQDRGPARLVHETHKGTPSAEGVVMTRLSRATVLLAGLVLLGTACSGGDSAEETSLTTAPATTTTTSASPTTVAEGPTTTSTATPTTTTTTTVPGGEDAELLDLLTFAQGTLFVEQTGLPGGSAGRALRMIDGDPQELTLSTDGGEPVELIYKLPSETTFDRFAIPNVVESPGNVTFFRSVTVSGSAEGPADGYQVLADFELETHGPDVDVTEVVPELMTPVRWVKVHLEGGINIVAGDEGRTNLEFTELIGNGTQAAISPTSAFTGIWDFRLTERLDLVGKPLELRQTGATIAGCLDTIIINGSVNGRIARATGIDPARNDRPSAFIFVADEDDSIQAVWSENNAVFGARSAVIDPDVTSSPCSAAPPEPQFCGVAIYVNFDFNSAAIRPESEQVLSDLYDGLVAGGVTEVAIEGHTSTEGSDAYNLDLSERRAQAVVDDLVERGFEEASISAVGKGETEPLLSPDDDESSRSLNRRVEIDCG
jgi:outer membrane protein OmpA-like peptidoglycan-associated protein